MAANTLEFNQISTILNSIVSQATGKAGIMPTNTSEFVTVAQTGLKTGYDNLLSAVSQVLSRTIFSNRPYTRKFKGLEADAIRYGNHVRKLQIADKDAEEDSRLPLTDGASVDQQVVSKPTILQTNFYGSNAFQRHYTIFKDQLDVAFSGPDEFAQFISLVTQNCSDMIEQEHENLARFTIDNYIAGVYASGSTSQIIHLLSAYNEVTGLNLTDKSVYEPANYPAFMKWVYAVVAAMSSMLTERSQVYHTNITGKEVSRHTPERDQRVYMLAQNKYSTDARVLADTYHDNYLKTAVNETVNFWQSINFPTGIKVTPTYMDTDGTLKQPSKPVTLNNVFGVIMDREAAGYTVVNQWSGTSPFNQRGGYQNIWFHFTDRYWNDFTENGVIFLLD